MIIFVMIAFVFRNEKQENLEEITPTMSQRQIQEECPVFEREALTFLNDEIGKVSVKQCDELIKKGEKLHAETSFNIKRLSNAISALEQKKNQLQKELEKITSDNAEVKQQIPLLIKSVDEEHQIATARFTELNGCLSTVDKKLNALREYKKSLLIYEKQ